MLSIALLWCINCLVVFGEEFGSLSLHGDSTFSGSHVSFVIGRSIQYGEIVIDTDQFVNDSDLLAIVDYNVYVCTSSNSTALIATLDTDAENIGCLSPLADVDGPYPIIGEDAIADYQGMSSKGDPAPNVARFHFLTFGTFFVFVPLATTSYWFICQILPERPFMFTLK